MSNMDIFNDTQQITIKVWLPGTHPGSHQEALTLENLAGLRYFLTTLAYGNDLFDDQQFDMIAYKNQRQVGQGTYAVHMTKDPIEPMKLDVTNEEGEIEDIVRDVWRFVFIEMYIGT